MPGLNGAPFEAIAGQLGPGLGAQDSKKPGALAQFRKKNPQTKIHSIILGFPCRVVSSILRIGTLHPGLNCLSF